MVAEDEFCQVPRAVCLIREREPYPHPHFIEGLRACGYKVSTGYDYKPASNDVLMIWNRSGPRDLVARQFERVGAAVIVTENGWIGRTRDGGKFYALCLGHHNGAGQWPVGRDDRLAGMNIELRPWRESGKHIVVLASRGIGEPGVAQPRDWLNHVGGMLKRMTRRPVVVRRHPGDSHAAVEDDLAGAHAVVTWASGAAIKAIAAGVPAFHFLPNWIGAPAARFGIDKIEEPFLGDRGPMFRRLAWAQYSADEIATGAPIKCLLTSRSTA